MPLRLRQPHAVDDRGVVELVADHGVLGVEQRLEHPAVGVEARREQDRVVGAEPVGDLVLDRAVLLVRAADEPDARHAEPVAVERRVRGRHDIRMRREAEVVVRAQVQVLAAVDRDARALRRLQRAFGLEQAVGLDLGERLLELVEVSRVITALPIR